MSRKTRKLIWSVPLVAVLAVAGALAAFMVLGINPAQAHDPPGAVTGLRVTVGGPTELKLSWTAPTTGGAVEGYRIDKSSYGQAWMPLETNAPSGMTTYSDKSIMDSTPRVYRVFAFNSSGTGPVSEAEAGTTSASSTPGPVTGLRAVRASGTAGRNSIVLTWNAPTNVGGSPLEQYHIYYAIGTADDGSTAFVDRGVADTGVLVIADNQIIGTGDTKTTYTHERLQETDNPRLSANTTYLYRVYAVNEDDNVSKTSDTRSATTSKTGRPSQPTGLTAVRSGAGAISLYWSHPADNGGTPIENFRIERRITAPNRGSWPTATATIITAAASITNSRRPDATNPAAEDAATVNEDISGLVAANTYEFRVYAENATDVEETAEITASRSQKPSNVVVVKPADADAFALLMLPVAPTTVEASRDSKGVVALEWTRTPNALSYRIDVSKNGHHWQVLKSSTGFTSGQYSYTDPEPGSGGQGVNRYYRVFERNRNGLGLASLVVVADLTPAADPGQVQGLTVTPHATDSTQIRVDWKAPTDTGNAFVRGYCIDYAITNAPIPQALLTGELNNDNQCANTAPDEAIGGRVKIEADRNPPTTYTLEKLSAKATVEFRVVSQTVDIGGTKRYSPIGAADTVSGTTAAITRPNAPMELTAESARDSNLEDTGNLGVNLLWNAPSAPKGLTIDGYRIQVSTDGGTTYTDVEVNTGTVTIGTALVARTYFTHESEPAADEVRMYRVAALDADATTEQSAWSNVVTFPAQMQMPGKPTGVMATKDADMPASEIKVSWSAPANGVEVTGYIIERRYGDMMMDITGYSGTDGANRNHAFMNYKEWWETLNCDGMLQAANIAPADATDEQKGMYCKHFLATAPSMVPDTEANADKKISDETAMKVKDLFMKRYVTDDMSKTMTMFTGMMYTDMGLMERTEYTYRVRAIHGMTAGMWSDAVMETTESADTTLGNAMGLMAGSPDDNDPAAIKLTWDAGANATTHTVVGVLRNADGTFDTSTVIWMTGVTSPLKVGMDARPAGTYIFGVVAGQIDGTDREWSNWARVTVAYQQ